jgi:endogenous inhibitor of DNA gyrase (YacG/DUF329 family)
MTSDTEKIVSCPACKGPSVYATSNSNRPFCSARCKGLDLGAWANEEFRLPAADKPKDIDLEHGPIH